MGLKQDLESRFDYDIVEDFLVQYDYILEILERIVLDLKSSQNYNKNINEIFRIMHNLKSAAGYLKLFIIINTAKFTEETLETARTLNGPATEEFVDWLLLIKDQLKIWINQIEKDEQEFLPINKKILSIPLELTQD